MNCVILCGRLTRDTEVKGEGDKKVAKYTLAVDRRFAKGEDKTDYINCIVFGKGVEFAEKYLKKGMKIIVRGRIQTGSYTNKDGQKVYTTDVVVEEQEFAESKGQSDTAPAPAVDDDFMNITPDALKDCPF